MQYIRLGETGLVVSRLAFGSMTFGPSAGPFASVYKVDQAGADALVARAIDAGINFFNSADVYAGGESERILGKAIGAKRKEVVDLDQGRQPHGTVARRDGSLAPWHLRCSRGKPHAPRHGLHRPVSGAQSRCDHRGRRDSRGARGRRPPGQGPLRRLSNWPAWMAAKAVGIQRSRGWSQFRAAEMYYSLVGRDLEHEIVPLCTDAGIGVMVWSPLAGGFLSGKYSRTKPKGLRRGSPLGVRLPPLHREHRLQSDRPAEIKWRETRRLTLRKSRSPGCSRDRRCRRSSTADVERHATGREPQGDGHQAGRRRLPSALEEATKAAHSVSALVHPTCGGRQGLQRRSACRSPFVQCADYALT